MGNKVKKQDAHICDDDLLPIANISMQTKSYYQRIFVDGEYITTFNRLKFHFMFCHSLRNASAAL